MSDSLHVLLHMMHESRPVTSEVLARSMNTNPVVIRRILAGLRNQEYIQSEKGHGGGWTLTGDPSKLTLLDIYLALGSPALFAFGNRSDAPDCLVEGAVNACLDQTLLDAGQLLASRFGEVTLARLYEDVQRRSGKNAAAISLGNAHDA